MRNNSLLTYLLYALLGIFIIAAGYYACQKQKEKKELAAREEAELQQALEDMGYAESDTASTKSSYTSTDTLSKPSPTGTKTAPSKTGATSNTKPAEKPIASNQKSTLAPSTATKPGTSTSSKPKTTAKGVAGPGSGRWAVRAGTFAYMEGARRRLEEVIKAGYPNAEISKTKEGKAAVVVFRSNDKAAAVRVVDQLEDKGIDAAVFDRY